MTFQSFWMPFLIGSVLLLIDNNLSLSNVVMLLMISFLVYLHFSFYIFKSLILCFKLTLIYLKTRVRALLAIVFRK